MPLRVSDYIERCSVCDEPQGEACRRCGRPLCPVHQPGSSSRCERCEAEYESKEEAVIAAQLAVIREQAREKAAGPLLGLALGSVCALIIGFTKSVASTLIISLPLVLLGVIGLLASIKISARQEAGFVELARGRYRTKFLAERPRHALPPASAVSPSRSARDS
jgi:hypothetical protein